MREPTSLAAGLTLEQDRQQVERLAARLSRAEQRNAVLRDNLARLVHTVEEAIPDAGPAADRLRFALDTIPAGLLNTTGEDTRG